MPGLIDAHTHLLAAIDPLLDGIRSCHTLGALLAVGGGRRSVQDTQGELAMRPIFQQRERRVEAHIFIAFPARDPWPSAEKSRSGTERPQRVEG